MIPFETLMLFLVTTFVVVLSPGPAAIAVTAASASNGFKRSFLVILGIAIANVVFFVLSATGIAALLIASHTLFSIIKWVGVAYLLYLGFTAIFSNAGPFSINASSNTKGSGYKAFLKGFVLELSNPKALLYFSALLPQFIDISNPILPQLALLCLITLILDLCCYSFYGYLGFKSTRVGIKPAMVKFINWSAGMMLIFAGVKMASIKNDI
ncbi:Putative homoserine/homoserine lactone efflux protein [Moritella viscosa]|uniref:LysE family translocator n=1 Tax=Moritella viscosa TaxID=80854 RepID=UPI00091D099D|nr:LysE family translocator [Moritella viscosa]SGZ05112.1 Putative homoserine/homoserine lactone efflux protein [Moritella viscosa]